MYLIEAAKPVPINIDKTKYVSLIKRPTLRRCTICLNGDDFKRVQGMKYLGSITIEDNMVCKELLVEIRQLLFYIDC